MPLAGGSMVGNVRLERELGRGAMGTVWRARHQALGSDVAVKVLQRGRHDPDTQARFAQEARGVASLDSPHMVRIFDYGMTAEGEPYLVMELLRGSDLRQHLAQTGRLDLRTAAVIVRQLCTALGAAHERGNIASSRRWSSRKRSSKHSRRRHRSLRTRQRCPFRFLLRPSR